ncbi:MAG: O-antigen ligase family protein [Prolixibacteraceae bacterium]|nr:O-antigen ligase family protein [Prolixibacteraceae bacterium]
MENVLQPFRRKAGSDRITSPVILLMVLAFIAVISIVLGKIGILGGVLLLLPPGLAFLYLLFRYPVTGIYTSIALGFLLLGLGRYIKGIPIGLGMDIILVLTLIALFFNRFYERIDWSPAKKDVFYLSLIWFAYSLFQIVNPEAQSFAAWFSGRGVAFYMFLLVPLTLILVDSNKKLDMILFVWGAFSILATLKGIMQLKLGVDPWEQAWLNEGNYKTHILFGRLRVFSFLSDAGQFGANQAYSGVVFSILVAAATSWKQRLFYFFVALLAFYGMVISGTRGALSVPLAGLGTFFILRKNKTIMITGFLMLVALVVFFKYTNIGQGNSQIRRMRSAFDPNDASLQVRLNNQRILKAYMASRPFGGGIGHGGVKAQRYLPNAYLSSIPTDSWYVLVWVEQGLIGLLLHLFILFYIVGKAAFKIMFQIRDPITKLKLSALTSGMFGIMVASYGNAVLGQMPTSILIYISMALILNSEQFEDLPDKIIDEIK